MNKIAITFLAIIISLSVSAQEKTKQHEVGISFVNLNEFGLTYKTGKANSLWRFATLFLNGNQNKEIADSIENNYNRTGFNIEVGKEFRKGIVENFELRYGFDLGFFYNKSETVRIDLANPSRDRDYTSSSYGSNINLVFGFNYIIKESLVIGAELLPSIRYSKGTRTEYDYNSGNYDELEISGFSYGFSSNSARLTFAYRF